LIEDVEKALKGMLAPEFTEKPIGKAVVLQVFSLSKGSNVAGCRVTEGEIRRNGKIRVTRGKDIVYEGEVGSLKHEKEDVREIRTGFECGIGLKNFNDVQIGDVIECFTLEKTDAE
jgi:translation initiation factor IF-2